MNKHYYNKQIQNFYDRDLSKIKKELDEYYALCLRFNDLALDISRAGFHYDNQNNTFDIVELFVAQNLREYGVNMEHIVNTIIEDNQ